MFNTYPFKKRAVNVQDRKQGQGDKMSASILANPRGTGNKAVDCVFHHVPALTVTWHEEARGPPRIPWMHSEESSS